MSTKTFLMLLALAVFCMPAFGVSGGNGNGPENDQSMFSLDEAAAYEAVSELSELEAYVEANEGVTLSEMQAEDPELLEGMEMADYQTLNQAMEPPLGIPSIIWGLVLGIIGVLIVHFSADSKDETRKSIIGCVIGALVWGGVGGLLRVL